MAPQIADRVLKLSSLIRELREARERMEGLLANFDDYVRRGGSENLRFGLVVLGQTGEFWIPDQYTIEVAQRAARRGLVDQLGHIDRQLANLQLPQE